MKIITIILGALLAVGGVYCMFTPVATYATIGWLIGVSMIMEGIASIIMWSELRRSGLANGWTLAGAILSIVLGIFLVGSYVARFSIDVFIAYLIAIWIVVSGISRIIGAINLRKQENLSNVGAGSSSWVILLLLGILSTILGVLCISNPLAVMVGVGFTMGLSIVGLGAGLIVGATRM